MDDLISRQAVIDLLKQMRKDGDMVPWEGKNVFARIRKFSSAQADVPDIHVGKWIPVSERLPEHGGYYIVTEMISEESWFVGVVLYRGTCERWFTDYEVTAWMPLPEPYKEGEEE
jgi:hypothetical protein